MYLFDITSVICETNDTKIQHMTTHDGRGLTLGSFPLSRMTRPTNAHM